MTIATRVLASGGLIIATGLCTTGTAHALSGGAACDAGHSSAFTVQLVRDLGIVRNFGQAIQPATNNAGGVVGQFNSGVSADCR